MNHLLTYIFMAALFGGVWFLASAALGYEQWQKNRVFRPEWKLGLVATFVLCVVLLAF